MGKYKVKETDKNKEYPEEYQGFHVTRLAIEKEKCRDLPGKFGYMETYGRV